MLECIILEKVKGDEFIIKWGPIEFDSIVCVYNITVDDNNISRIIYNKEKYLCSYSFSIILMCNITRSSTCEYIYIYIYI